MKVQHYDLLESFGFVSAKHGPIVVPPGFLSDFGSVPRIAQAVIDDDDPHLLFASIIHDWLYARFGVVDGLRQSLTRVEADGVLAEAMRASGAPKWKVVLVHAAVRIGGRRHWANSAFSRRLAP